MGTISRQGKTNKIVAKMSEKFMKFHLSRRRQYIVTDLYISYIQMEKISPEMSHAFFPFKI